LLNGKNIMNGVNLTSRPDPMKLFFGVIKTTLAELQSKFKGCTQKLVSIAHFLLNWGLGPYSQHMFFVAGDWAQ
jgi:hypothetical protein